MGPTTTQVTGMHIQLSTFFAIQHLEQKHTKHIWAVK
jgi:hypothetical protein